jgi:hypothetical protein
MTQVTCALLLCSALLAPLKATAGDPPPGYDWIRAEFVPATIGGSTDEKDQIAFAVAVVDGTNFKSFPNTYKEFNFDGSNGAPLYIRIPVCQHPFFLVTVANKSDQILKLRSAGPGGDEVVVVMEDEQGSTIEATRKKVFLDQLAAMKSVPGAEKTVDPQKASTLMKDEYLQRWFESRNEMTLGFFDVPVSRDAGGAVKKKTSYQVKFLVKMWKDRWEYEAREETKSWTPVVKSSTVIRDVAQAPKTSTPPAGSTGPAPSTNPK